MAIQIITTVGTSIFTNFSSEKAREYLKDNLDNLGNIIELIKDLGKKNANHTDEDKEYIIDILFNNFLFGIERLKDTKGEFYWDKSQNQSSLNKSCCAEIQTIEAIALKPEFEGQELHIHLLTTETVLSNLAARIIEMAYDGHSLIKIMPIVEVKGLQVDNFADFKGIGLQKLIDEITKILRKKTFLNTCYRTLTSKNSNADEKLIYLNNLIEKAEFTQFSDTKDKIIEVFEQRQQNINVKEYLNSTDIFSSRNSKTILNISGGYKIVIPILTLLGQLYDLPLYYNYEDSEELIEIGKMPFSFDWILAEKCLPLLNIGDFATHNTKNEFKPLIKEMQDKGLIDANFNITIIGELFKKYANLSSPTKNMSVGTFYEYLLLEYYLTYYNVLPIRSYDIANISGKEVDILLEENNNIVLVEAKGLGRFLSVEGQNEILEQIETKLHEWFNEVFLGGEHKNKKESDLRTLVNYRISFWMFAVYENHLELLRTIFTDFKTKTEKKYPTVEFSVDYVAVPTNFLTYQPDGETDFKKDVFFKKILKDDLKTLIGKPISDFITIKS